MKEALTYLGMRFDKHGVMPLQEKIKAVLDIPAPENILQIRVFLGMLNYYRFGNLANILDPLHLLL